MNQTEHNQDYANFLSILRRSTELLTDDPIREEIFSVERLEQYAGYLAKEFKVSANPKKGQSLLPEIKECGKQLHIAYLSLSEAIRGKQSVSPAAEWFLDNFHIIEEQLRGIKRDLPVSYYDELPKLESGELTGYPRVYAIALAIIAHTDSRLDVETLKRFILAFQQVSPLQIGELWAVAITLRIALIEHLKPLALRIVSAREKRAQADALADKILDFAVQTEIKSHQLVEMLARELGGPEKFDRAFIVQLISRLRDQDPDVWPVFDWLETQLKTHNTNTVSVTQFEHHRQAAAQLTVGNIITSMRLLSAMDWRDFFESVCTVDQLLAGDPVGAYSKMDFVTRDQYRHAVERIAKRSGGSELQVVKKAIELGMEVKKADSTNERCAHVGYFLIGDGVLELEKIFHYKPKLKEKISRLVLNHPTFLYLGSLCLLTAMAVVPVTKYYFSSGGESIIGAFFLSLLALFPASEFALSFLNHFITFLMKPKPLPKMDTEKGIPSHAKTMVVIPTLFTRSSVVSELLERLEVHYLANTDPNIYFALLGDFGDSQLETTPQDKPLLDAALKGIDDLNLKYCQGLSEKCFYLFHRKRQWNSSEEMWIGWERKRGKLLEFNQLLRGAENTSYLKHNTPKSLLAAIRYVITLDSDTQLPRNCAGRLVGTILHPLNSPQYCPVEKRVVRGYGILQPRISVDLVSSSRTRFARIFSGNTGLDPYTTAVSDVYQDLFSEGSFTGKGLYEVDAFEKALKNRGPENSVLSHDLFEGSYARAALVTDVELFDDYPSDYDTFSKRLHRWTRGDWQIAQWLFSKVPDASGKQVPNNLTLISRWKIFDNLRRSLVTPAIFIWLTLSWSVLPGSPFWWTLPILLILGFPIYSPLFSATFITRHGMPWHEYFKSEWNDVVRKSEQIVLMTAFLAALGFTQVDAVLRTLYRKLISKKRLLEWVTFAQVEHRKKKSFSFLDFFFPGPFFGLLVLITTIIFKIEALKIAAPFLILWIANPLIKTWLQRKEKTERRPLSAEEKKDYRLYARQTWHFFETFVGEEDNWLAPDNFQEDPKPVIAHRTSPTNIGLQFLSIVSAYDFGYIGLLELTEFLEKGFHTLSKLQIMNGHFFNWYDTKTLEPLKPQYISTVDSGNLAGHLLALKQSCLEISLKPFENKNARMGLIDTLDLALAVAVKTADQNAIAEIKKIQNSILSLKFEELEKTLNDLVTRKKAENDSEIELWLNRALYQTRQFLRDASEIIPSDLSARLTVLMARCDEVALGMDFRFLFDEQRKIFSIGYNATDGRRDNSYYDLLASESRLASFVAIAKGDVSEEHWFRLGRQMTKVKGSRALIAWTATMFEYLMPLIVMRRYNDTLLDQTYEAVVARQIEYGKQHHVPWGISEAGYNARDLNLNYQYGPFGVPGLGLKRGLSDDLVISPYSTMLASIIDPQAALVNLKSLASKGALSRYGFYESIDYTPQRLQENQKSFILRSYMAHHQGMSLISLNNLLNGGILQKRFHSEPRIQATQLLLQERIPRAVTISQPRAEEAHDEGMFRFSTTSNPRFYSDVHVATPRTQILSNGTYCVLVTSSGAGYSRCGPLAVSRWREDWTSDHWGHFFYIRNRSTGEVWSSGYQPTTVEPKKYEVTFSEDKVELLREDGEIVTHTEIIVSPEDNVELRRISLTNHSSEACEFEVTSFMEAVFAVQNDDVAHPAFSNLFVQTEFVAKESALLATRRQRSKFEKQVWGFHVVVTEGEVLGPVQYETDRSRFIGRGHSAFDPVVVKEGRPLSNTVGSVLDPIFSLREIVRIPPNATVRVAFATGVAPSREEALRLSDKYHDIHIFAREAEISWTQSQVQLRHLNIGTDKAHIFQRLAGRIVFADPSLRPRSHTLSLNTKNQSGLWAYGISGDLPILLTRISDEKDMAMVRELLHCHEYLRLKGLSIDLVILNERAPSYLQFLQDALQRQIRMSGSQSLLDKPGGVFIRRTDIMPEEDVQLLKTIARVTLSADKGTLDEQLKRRTLESVLPEKFVPTSKKRPFPKPALTMPELLFFNGLGGFTTDAKTYFIILRENQFTPAPWINVIANEKDFGFTISESGSGYTWSANSRENRLSSWSNDAVVDPVSEAIYIRDEETGECWTPTPLPIREAETYVIKHGQGYTQFEHTSHQIEQELKVFVPVNDTVKVSCLKLKNLGTQKRKLSITGYVEWVLGFSKGLTSPTVITEHDIETGALFARNPYNNEFASRIAFADMSELQRTFTCDRKEFLGRNGSTARPLALKRIELSGRSGAGLDPCAAIQSTIELQAGEEREIVFILGDAENINQAKALTLKYRTVSQAKATFEEVTEYWDKTLSTIEIKTPDKAMNVMVNSWLLYQTLSCRVWARTAFYQSGGAFGFRDQLQDVMALVYSKPEIARNQILKSAARQFVEGDVQHWWHPPTGRGVRTRFSDDLLWLPFVTSFYVNVTGDDSILEEVVPFIEAPTLEVGVDDSYQLPKISTSSATLYDHCIRTIDRSLKTGSHGLPLMGSGDWNDGMNRVGHEGTGESVWVGWFLCSTLKQFVRFCEKNKDINKFNLYTEHLAKLKKSIEANAWDGDWYRRAYFDNGEALGSAFNEECRIDSIAQSWAVLSGEGDPKRIGKAMAAVDEYLIHRGDGLIKLFAPPFDKGHMDPGYIKGYVPGVRENGGQYTHAAIWTVMAYAALGDGDRAGELYTLLNPINHAATPAGVHKYKVEPFVVAGDIYGLDPHIGRGGWSWYTGSSSWMYRSALESILGFNLCGDKLKINPCIPKQWREFEIIYRIADSTLIKKTEYKILVSNSDLRDQEMAIELDGKVLDKEYIPIVKDGKKHVIKIQLGNKKSGS